MPISKAKLDELKKRLDEHEYDPEAAQKLHDSLPELRDDVDVVAIVIPKRKKKSKKSPEAGE
jgi:hypothetical protein